MSNEYCLLSGNCIFCKKVVEIKVHEKDYFKYTNGAKVIDAFPYLDIDAREFLISKVCPTCYLEIFPPKTDKKEKG